MGDLITPLGTGFDALVVPDIEAEVSQPDELRVHERGVAVGIAHKDVGLLTGICWKWSIHGFNGP